MLRNSAINNSLSLSTLTTVKLRQFLLKYAPNVSSTKYRKTYWARTDCDTRTARAFRFVFFLTHYHFRHMRNWTHIWLKSGALWKGACSARTAKKRETQTTVFGHLTPPSLELRKRKPLEYTHSLHSRAPPPVWSVQSSFNLRDHFWSCFFCRSV